MNQHSPIHARGSLLERASEVFDFRKAFEETTPVPVAAEPERTPEPEPEIEAAPQPEPEKGVETALDPVPVPEPKPAPSRPKPIALVRPAVPGGARIDRVALAESGLIVPGAATSALSEEFRIVKRQLLLEAEGAGSGKPLARGRMILICSAQPNEGKTFCAVNLALSMAAEEDNEVLLVDADFGKPEIVAMLGLENGPGLLDALADPALSVESCVIRTDIPGFSVLPAGRHTNNDTELLASARTRAVLGELLAANPARVVIFDSPPALAASPASVLALHAGQALMVVKADKTSEADLRDALGLLAGCEHIQLLLNGVQFAGGGRRFGSYYGYGD